MSATIIPFPTPAAPNELLELEAHLLEVYATRLEELSMEASIDADPRLVGRMRELADYCDRLAGAAGADDVDVDDALDEASAMLDQALEAITRSSVRRLVGAPLLEQLDEGLMLASAFATISHLDHVAFEHEGRLVAAQPLDRLLLRRFMRAVVRGYVFARERAQLDQGQAERLRALLVDRLIEAADQPERTATSLRDALLQLHAAWLEEATPDVRAELQLERADATPERGEGAEAVQRSFDVGVACAIARAYLADAANVTGGRVPIGTDPVDWLATLCGIEAPAAVG